MRQILLLVALLLAPICSGCGSVHATDQTPIWSARDAAEYLTEMRATREAQDAQSEDLKALRKDVAETLDSVNALHGAVESLQVLIAGGSSLPPVRSEVGADAHAEGKPVGASEPICFKLDGIDTDISGFIDEWLGERDWTFTVNGQSGSDTDLRGHMSQEGVTETEGIASHILHELHSAWHEYALANPKPVQTAQSKPVSVFNLPPIDTAIQQAAKPVGMAPQNCPNGQCPMTTGTTTVQTPYASSVRSWSYSTPAQQRKAARQSRVGWFR